MSKESVRLVQDWKWCPKCGGRWGVTDQCECCSFNTAPPAQPAGVEATLRRILERGKHRTDGDLATLLDRVEHMTRGDQDCIAMQRSLLADVKERGTAQPAERVPEGLKLAIAHIQQKADAYAEEHCGVEWDTGATTYHHGQAGEDYHHGLLELVDELKQLATTPAAPAEEGDGRDGWIDVATLPSVKDGHEAHFWIAVRRAHGDKVYVFPAIYANGLPLSCGDYDPEDLDGPFWKQRILPEDSDGDIAITGWYDIRSNVEYDSYYTPVCNRGDVILAWHKGPEFPTTGAAR